jgi:SPP1 family predicted phage head-tail adaptor
MAQESAAIGRMRRRLVLEAPVASPDGLGGTTQAFEAVAAFWAQVEWISGIESWRQGRPEQSRNYRITMRWRGDVDAGRRLRDGDRIFDIRSAADPDGARQRLVCLAEEVTP